MIEYALMVLLTKSVGVVYFFLFFVAVLVYAYLPRNKKSFSEAANSIITDEDKPCQ